MRRFLRSERAQAMVEFALVLPIILLLLFGMLQLALVLNARQTVAYAAQAAANAYAQSLQVTWSQEQAVRAAAQLRPALTWSDVTFTLISGPSETPITTTGTGVPGDLVAAQVRYGYPSPIRARIAGFGFPDTIGVTAEAVARVEKPDATTQSGGGASVTPPPSTPPPGPRTCYMIWILLEQYTPGLDVTTVRRYVDGSDVIVQYAAPGTTHSYLVTAPGATSAVSGSFTLPSTMQDQWYGQQRFLEYPNGRARLTERAASWSGSECRR